MCVNEIVLWLNFNHLVQYVAIFVQFKMVAPFLSRGFHHSLFLKEKFKSVSPNNEVEYVKWCN